MSLNQEAKVARKAAQIQRELKLWAEKNLRSGQHLVFTLSLSQHDEHPLVIQKASKRFSAVPNTEYFSHERLMATGAPKRVATGLQTVLVNAADPRFPMRENDGSQHYRVCKAFAGTPADLIAFTEWEILRFQPGNFGKAMLVAMVKLLRKDGLSFRE